MPKKSRTELTGDSYTTNAQNQYTDRTNNTLPISGTASPESAPPGGAGGTAVAAGGRTVASGRQGAYWADELTVPNVLQAWRGPVTIFTAQRGTGGSPDRYRVDTRMAEIGALLQEYAYDDDGNLTSDGIVDYQWDAENRLIRMETTAAAGSWGFPRKRIEFRYDYMGRRVSKQVLSWNASSSVWDPVSHRRFLYDGWNLIAEYAVSTQNSNLTLVRSYTWGLDIVSTLADAGGVGALLQIADHPTGKTYLPTYDGNGNIVSLLNGTSGALAAVYEYGPFGEALRAQSFDVTIADNPWRFSTKFTDLETGLVYYGHRYYSSSLGRFVNRDPIEEAGGINLYGFVVNDGVNRWDYLGFTGVGTHIVWSYTEEVTGSGMIPGFGTRTVMIDNTGRLSVSWNSFYTPEPIIIGTSPVGWASQSAGSTASTSSSVFNAQIGSIDTSYLGMGLSNTVSGGLLTSDLTLTGLANSGVLTGSISSPTYTGYSSISGNSSSWSTLSGADALGQVSVNTTSTLTRIANAPNEPVSTRAGNFAAGTLLLAGAMVADDATIIGIADDPLIPVVVVGGLLIAGGVWVYDHVNGPMPIQVNSDKTTQSRPTNAPPGTRPIDQSGLGKDAIHGIKEGVGAGPKDWTGIAPNGDVITTGPDGKMINNGPKESYIPGRGEG